MALDAFLVQYAKQIITGNAIAMLCTASAHGATNREYVRGILDTTRSQATSFGIQWNSVAQEIRQALQDAGREDLIEAVGRGMIGEG